MHTAALIYSTASDFDRAVQIERKAHALLLSLFGAEDPRVKDSAAWIKSFTTQSVDTRRKAMNTEAEKRKEAALEIASAGSKKKSKGRKSKKH
jgi:hypothetical protein